MCEKNENLKKKEVLNNGDSVVPGPANFHDNMMMNI